MARIVTRDEVRELVDRRSAQLVDVLPRAEYDDEHIAGAISLPLKELSATTASRLDPTQPVITYCHDSL
jgi:rhodanese-related sulfurtransferase